MKILYIVRHAKSSWDFPMLSDMERPLLEKGIRRTRLVAKFLKKNKTAIYLMVSSSAKRAYETALILAKELGYPPDNIIIDNHLYRATADDISDLMYEIPDSVSSLMIVAHNPTLTEFANYFLTEKIDWLPTSGIVSLSFDTATWDKVRKSVAVNNTLIFPKMLK